LARVVASLKIEKRPVLLHQDSVARYFRERKVEVPVVRRRHGLVLHVNAGGKRKGDSQWESIGRKKPGSGRYLSGTLLIVWRQIEAAPADGISRGLARIKSHGAFGGQVSAVKLWDAYVNLVPPENKSIFQVLNSMSHSENYLAGKGQKPPLGYRPLGSILPHSTRDFLLVKNGL